eukprot:614928-Hanusia_phi.AAC.1
MEEEKKLREEEAVSGLYGMPETDVREEEGEEERRGWEVVTVLPSSSSRMTRCSASRASSMTR